MMCHMLTVTHPTSSNEGDADARTVDAGDDANANTDANDATNAGTLKVAGLHTGLRRRLQRQQRLGRGHGGGDGPLGLDEMLRD